jgi:hypothetical protein
MFLWQSFSSVVGIKLALLDDGIIPHVNDVAAIRRIKGNSDHSDFVVSIILYLYAAWNFKMDAYMAQ